MELEKGYRRYEQIAIQELSDRGNDVKMTPVALDIKGVDLEGTTAKGKTLGIYARARFGRYRDITFNGAGAIKKLIANCEKYDEFGCVLHYATGNGFTDPSSTITHSIFINLKKWVRSHDSDFEKIKQDLVWKDQNGGFFILPKPVWEQFLIEEKEHNPPISVNL